jgi:hypothetical protein
MRELRVENGKLAEIGVPRYDEAIADERPDTFILSGAEDLVPVPGATRGRTRFRPRAEGLFARIEHIRGGGGDFRMLRYFCGVGLPISAWQCE